MGWLGPLAAGTPARPLPRRPRCRDYAGRRARIYLRPASSHDAAVAKITLPKYGHVKHLHRIFYRLRATMQPYHMRLLPGNMCYTCRLLPFPCEERVRARPALSATVAVQEQAAALSRQCADEVRQWQLGMMRRRKWPGGPMALRGCRRRAGGRDRVPEEMGEVRRGAASVQRHGGSDGKLPGWGVPRPCRSRRPSARRRPSHPPVPPSGSPRGRWAPAHRRPGSGPSAGPRPGCG